MTGASAGGRGTDVLRADGRGATGREVAADVGRPPREEGYAGKRLAGGTGVLELLAAIGGAILAREERVGAVAPSRGRAMDVAEMG